VRKFISAVLVCLMAFMPVGCGADQIIAGLQTAQNVSTQAQKILAPVNPEVANIAGVVATDLGVIVKAYQDYDVAADGDKPTKAQLVLATAQSITNNLSAILDAVRIKNPQLLTEITIFVAVVNSALVVVLAKIPNAGLKTQAAIVGNQGLPVIKNAKNAKDLKTAWNSAVSKSFPHNKI